MSKSNPTAPRSAVTDSDEPQPNNSTDRAITDDRYERALTEPRSVTFTGAGIAEVAEGITAYEVELGSGRCECDDYRFRGDEIVCKHVIRAALAALFCDDQRDTELVARVAQHAHEHGCVHGIGACNGPTDAADRRDGMPCQGCVESMKSDCADEWAAWNAFARSAVAR